ncbi:MAG: hypothetical protein LBE92_04260 [Chryseobacterium sp.]|jgi:flagellar basal body-associated protein FliL|uniref:hypothetical protein n=1 Tax=Chryseobacterium sp. TaxID=1871047 RepID=UPI002823B209|nr:hypothetical protein [Chryseobacterium sp.]MDR2235317.1 hypothetical protein [Chryseobacterium sp.]
MSETNNSEKSKSNLESIVNGTNWVALGVVAFAVIGLVAIIFNLLSKEEENNAPKKIIIKYEINVDKINLKNVKDSTTLKMIKSLDENNKKVLNEINSSVNAQYTRMESILSVQEDRSKLFSYGAGFLAILVAIATFFGFKSINEMKKSTIEAAEYEAKKIAEEEAKKVAQQVAEEKTKEELAKKLEEIKSEILTSLTSEFHSKLEQRELNVSDEFSYLIRVEFDNKLNELRDELTNFSENTTPDESSSETTTENSSETVNDLSNNGNSNINGDHLFNDDDLTN